MAIMKKTITVYRCERCEHEWEPRDVENVPTICPKCKSAYWQRPRTTPKAKRKKKVKRKAPA